MQRVATPARAASFLAAVAVTALAVALPAQAQTFTVLHEFNGAADGANPEGALLLDAAGNLYGTTFAGGGIGEGTVYRIDSAGEETVLLDFSAFESGGFPASPLIQDAAGNLYGIADEGPGGAGVVFKVSPQGQQELLFAFQGGLDTRNARVPSGGIRMDKAGNIFGTTLFGGPGRCQSGCGSVFRLDSTGTLRVLHNFSGGADGSKPFGPLASDADGNLYGVAQSGGALCPEAARTGCGTVFKLARNRELTVLHTFLGGADGATPQPGLLRDAAGNLFGAAAAGGTNGDGLVFRIASDGTYTVVHQFTGQDGSTPKGGLVADAAGNLYGTAQGGGAKDLGTVFVLNRSGQVRVLHTFT
jgi:uncharacterized repeat protein (TIGR03803 family)